MKISINWIKDFVNLDDISEKDLINKFTLSTAEIEDVIYEGELLHRLKIVEITDIQKHPDAEKLNLVTFKLSESESFRVVCGASNVEVGKKVPFAPLGTSFPNGLVLTPKKIRGILSEGMLCSGEELGFEESSDGLYIFNEDAQIGQSVGEYLKIDRDIILDIDNKSLTHRPDLWGHFGIAREFAAIFDRELCDGLKLNKITPDIVETPKSVVVDKQSCGKAYLGLSMKGVKIGPSSLKIQERLKAAGINPKNNIVDISNYVMLEFGVPNHIFDYNQLSGEVIRVEELKNDIEFKTLDDVERSLVVGDTVVSDDSGPLVIAGIMGGQKSAVTESTSNLFIEVANWAPSRVRQTSTRLGLRTDSSQRYEKSLDSKQVYRTLYRLVELIKQECPNSQVWGSPVYDGEKVEDIPQISITTSVKKINDVLGVNMDGEKIKSILSRLDFELTEKGESLIVAVPSYRATKDVEVESDLIEEVGRIIGYDNIDPVAPVGLVRPVKLSRAKALHRKIRDFLVYSSRSNEVMTYPLVGKKLFDQAGIDLKSLELINSLSEDASFMRPSVIPSVLSHIQLNLKSFENCDFFEIAKVYLEDQADFAREENHLVYGSYSKNKESKFISVVNNVEKLLLNLNLPYQLIKPMVKFPSPIIPAGWHGVHPIEKYDVKVMGKVLGSIFSFHPLLLKKFKIKGNLSICVMNLSFLEKAPIKSKFKYKAINKYPGAIFDCTVDVELDTSIEDILRGLSKLKSKLLKRSSIKDVFIRDGRKYVTLSNIFQDNEKTLDGQEIKILESAILANLEKNNYFLKR
jgi:phenylalanyl-tRNA synthetase beta chain